MHQPTPEPDPVLAAVTRIVTEVHRVVTKVKQAVEDSDAATELVGHAARIAAEEFPQHRILISAVATIVAAILEP